MDAYVLMQQPWSADVVWAVRTFVRVLGLWAVIRLVYGQKS